MFDDYKEIQPIAYKILKRTLEDNKYSHAYFIETNNYENSMEFILSYIKEIFYKEKSNSYSEKQISIMIDSNEFSELTVIDTDDQWIKKEQLLLLQEEFNKKSVIGNKKIYIIKNADKLNNIAANSILKFLEEPKNGIIAILMADNRYKILGTILSRCQIITLNKKMSYDSENKLLKIEKILNIETENDNKGICEKITQIKCFIKFFENNHLKSILYINKYWFDYFSTKEGIYQALILVLLYYKDILNLKINREMEIFDYSNDIKEVIEKNSLMQIVHKIEIVDKNIQKIRYNTNLGLLMDKLIIEMSDV